MKHPAEIYQQGHYTPGNNREKITALNFNELMENEKFVSILPSFFNFNEEQHLQVTTSTKVELTRAILKDTFVKKLLRYLKRKRALKNNRRPFLNP